MLKVVENEAENESSLREHLDAVILPPYMRRSPKVSEVLPVRNRSADRLVDVSRARLAS